MSHVENIAVAVSGLAASLPLSDWGEVGLAGGRAVFKMEQASSPRCF